MAVNNYVTVTNATTTNLSFEGDKGEPRIKILSAGGSNTATIYVTDMIRNGDLCDNLGTLIDSSSITVTRGSNTLTSTDMDDFKQGFDMAKNDYDANDDGTIDGLEGGTDAIFDSLTVNGVGGVVALTPAAQVAGGGTVGAAITGTSGAGSLAAGAVAAGAGGAALVTGGAGGASDGTDASAAGGVATVTGGAGGAAHTAEAGEAGGASSVVGGAGGAGSAGAAGGAGGNATLNAGAGGVTGGGGAGADGAVDIGTADTLAINIGNATDNPATSFAGTGAVDMPSLTVDGVGGIVNLTPVAQAAGAGTIGGAVTVTSGAGSLAAGAVAAAAGGVTAITGGVGGASDGTDASAVGGIASVTGGAGGAAHTAEAGSAGGISAVTGGAGGAGSAGALGGDGGNAVLNPGAGGVTGGGGAGADGSVVIGSANTAAILISNVTDNNATTFQGTGTVTMPSLTVDGVGGVIALTPAAQAAGGGAVGGAVTGTAGAGSLAGGAVAAGDGGATAITGGVGGASDGADAAGVGGAGTFDAGAGGAAHTAVVGGIGGMWRGDGGAGGAGSAGAVGGAGGGVALNAGPGGVTGGAGAGADGALAIASANTASVEIGNVTDNPTIEFLGTANIDMAGGGDIVNERLLQVVIVAADVGGGATASTLSVQVSTLDGVAVTHAVDLEMNSSLTRYAGINAQTGTGFFGAATTGTLNAGTGTLWAHITTSATGLYESAINNAADETCWFSARTATGGQTALANGCVIVAVVADDATWA